MIPNAASRYLDKPVSWLFTHQETYWVFMYPDEWSVTRQASRDAVSSLWTLFSCGCTLVQISYNDHSLTEATPNDLYTQCGYLQMQQSNLSPSRCLITPFKVAILERVQRMLTLNKRILKPWIMIENRFMIVKIVLKNHFKIAQIFSNSLKSFQDISRSSQFVQKTSNKLLI